MRYYLGADLGGTKTHMVLADETGQTVGFSEGGPGNHEVVGQEGMFETLRDGLEQALQSAGLAAGQIAGAGYGIAGYDWPDEHEIMAETVRRLGLEAPFMLVNDAVPGLVAAASEGWGVCVVSGTGCNCRGLDLQRREGRVTGHGIRMGEGAGASEMIFRAMQLVSYSWMRRLPPTALSELFIKASGARDLEDLIEGYSQDKYEIGPELAPQVFEVARQGDPIAIDLIRWAGVQLGELAWGVIRQLEFEKLEFDVILSGSMFSGGSLLIEPMRQTIHQVAPGARLVRLNVPPVMGAVLLGMEVGGVNITPAVRSRLSESINQAAQVARQKTGR